MCAYSVCEMYSSLLPTLQADNTDGVHRIHRWFSPPNHRGVPPAFPPPALTPSW